jgi:hypothetical protein
LSESDDAQFEVDAHVFVISMRCQECGRRWNDPTERWRVYFTDEDPPDPGSYCPDCARREFAD